MPMGHEQRRAPRPTSLLCHPPNSPGHSNDANPNYQALSPSMISASTRSCLPSTKQPRVFIFSLSERTPGLDVEFGDFASFPDNADRNPIPDHALEHHFVDQAAQHGLLLRPGHIRPRQSSGSWEPMARKSSRSSDANCSGGGKPAAMGQGLLRLSKLAHRHFPTPLQFRGDQAVIRIDAVILPLGQKGLIAQAFDLLRFSPVEVSGRLLFGLAGPRPVFKLSRSDGCKERSRHTRVDRIGGQVLAQGDRRRGGLPSCKRNDCRPCTAQPFCRRSSRTRRCPAAPPRRRGARRAFDYADIRHDCRSAWPVSARNPPTRGRPDNDFRRQFSTPSSDNAPSSVFHLDTWRGETAFVRKRRLRHRPGSSRIPDSMLTVGARQAMSPNRLRRGTVRPRARNDRITLLTDPTSRNDEKTRVIRSCTSRFGSFMTTLSLSAQIPPAKAAPNSPRSALFSKPAVRRPRRVCNSTSEMVLLQPK